VDLPSPAQPKTLEVLENALSYREWIFGAARPHLGPRVLEIGAGQGTLTACIADREAVLAVELDPDLEFALRKRFDGMANVEIVAGSATDADVMRVAAGRIDSAMSFNVLEHILDDTTVLRNVFNVLPPGGRFVCFVPACPSIYGSIDKAVGHVRRYTRAEIKAKMAAAGFVNVEARYMNFIGYFAWFVAGRLFRFHGMGEVGVAVRAYDRIVIPISRYVEGHFPPPFGQSLLAVGERPTEPGGAS
jgi:SAM-dependent methyltransferase